MKALKIDSEKGIVIEVESNGLSDLQEYVGGWITVGLSLPLDGETTDTLFVDDEGLLKNPEHFFLWEVEKGIYVDEKIKWRSFAGNGIIVGTDTNGESVDCTLSMADVTKKIAFVNVREIQMLAHRGEIA